MAEEVKKIKISYFVPPLTRLFEKNMLEFFDICAWSKGEVRSYTFAWFKKTNEPSNIITASKQRYMIKFLNSFT